jgi:DoxX-like family
MFIAYAVVAILLALGLLGSAQAKLTKKPQIVEGFGKLGVPPSWFPALASAEIAGAVGLVVGLWVVALGIAASIGIILYFVGAVSTHLRAHDRRLAPPVLMGLIGVAALTLRILSL